jgi:hypothetical protein
MARRREARVETLVRDWERLIGSIGAYCREALATALALLVEQAVIFGVILAIIYVAAGAPGAGS